MIWAVEDAVAQGRDEAVDAIMDELRELCGQVMPVGEAKLEEVTIAIEEALNEQSEECFLDSGRVLALASQALSAIGEDQAARRLYLFGSGMVRPGEWNVAGDQTLWVLDLKPLAIRGCDLLEMHVFATLGRILEAVADVWDDSDGRGVLGLTNVLDAPASTLAEEAARRRLTKEIMTVCADKLRRIGELKGWSDAPAVMDLDLRRSAG